MGVQPCVFRFGVGTPKPLFWQPPQPASPPRLHTPPRHCSFRFLLRLACQIRKSAGYPPAGPSSGRVASIRILSAWPQAPHALLRSKIGTRDDQRPLYLFLFITSCLISPLGN